MTLESVGCLCLCLCFWMAGVRSQRAWGSAGSWGSAGGDNPYSGNVVGGGSWGSSALGFGGRPGVSLPSSQRETNSNLGHGNSGWNQGKQVGWQSGGSRRPDEKKLGSITDLASSSQWSANPNAFPSDRDDGLAVWGSSDGGKAHSGSQNSKPGAWYSNNVGNDRQSENEIPTDFGREDDAKYPPSGSGNKKKHKPGSGPSGGSGNWETTTRKTDKNSGTTKWETSDDDGPRKPSVSAGSSQTGKEKPPAKGQGQNGKPTTADASILDELDKNDWYFGKESDYPKPPFRSTLNIDVSELWNFDKNKKPSQNSKGNGSNNNNNNNNNKNKNQYNNNSNNDKNQYKNNSNNNKNQYNNNNNNNKNQYNNNDNSNNKNQYNNNDNSNNKNQYNNNDNSNNKNQYNNNNNRRWNRQIEGTVGIQCECVKVNECEEEDAIVTQEDVKFDFRPLEEFRCEKLTEVCCTSPKSKLTNRVNFNEEKEQLKCGERRPGEKTFAEMGEDVADPGEFPWNLRLENAEIDCSASLVHRRMALTAAHCIAGALPGELALRAGVWNSKDEPSQSRRVTKMIPHPDYDGRNPRNDVALLILETPFELTDNVNTVCLPVTDDKWDPRECAVAGWRTKEIQGQTFQVLEKGVVSFLPQAECQNIMLVTDLWRNYVLHDSFVCGLERTGGKRCRGDEGGSVSCPSRKRPGAHVQIGIVSKGMNCDAFGRPGIFTNLLKFLDWINKTYFELGLFDDVDVRSLAESR